MSELLKHTDVTPFALEHLSYTRDWKDLTDPVRGTFLPNFFIVYFGQEIPQGRISNDDEKTAMAKMGPGYDLWVTTTSDAINNMEDIDTIMDAFGVVGNLTQDKFYKKYFYANYDKVLTGQSLQSNLKITLRKLVISRRFSSHSKCYLSQCQYPHRRPSLFSFLQISRKKS